MSVIPALIVVCDKCQARHVVRGDTAKSVDWARESARRNPDWVVAPEGAPADAKDTCCKCAGRYHLAPGETEVPV